MTHKTPAPAWLTGLADFWDQYGYRLVLAGLAVAFLFVMISLLVAHKRKHLDRWVSVVTWIAVYGFSADGMWIVATQKAHLPAELAVAVFFVGDAMMINSMIRSRRRYTRTTVRAWGKVIKPGDPGKHGRAVWLIATVMGLIVAFSSHNPVEWTLRLSLPLGAALMWWNDLTADGITAQRTTWRWTPRRLLLWLGAIVPGDEDLETVSERRQLDELTDIALRAHNVVLCSDRARARARRRLTARLPLAGPGVLEQVQQRVTVADRAVELTAPGTRTLLDEIAAERADMARQIAEVRRQAADAVAVARQQAAAMTDRRVAEVVAEAQREAAEAQRVAAAETAAREAAEATAGRQAAEWRAEAERRRAAEAAAETSRREAAEATAHWRREAEARVAAEAAAAEAAAEAEALRRRPAPAGGGSGGGSRAAAGGGSGGGRRGGGWPETMARCEQLAAEDLSPGEIAARLGISTRTLREHRQLAAEARAADPEVAEATIERARRALSNGHVPAPAGVA
jgi:hypothetical protein